MFNITDVDHEEVVKTSDCGWRREESGGIGGVSRCIEGMHGMWHAFATFTCCKYPDLWTFSNTKGKLYLLIKVANFFFFWHMFSPIST